MVTLDGSASTDPDDDPLSYQWSVDGVTYTGAVVDLRFDDDATTTATLTVSDGRGGSDTATVDIVVLNAPPVVTATAGPDVRLGLESHLSVSVTDAGVLDTHRVTIDWGDGNATGPDPIDGTLDQVHTYSAAGTHAVQITVCDDDGGCDSDSTSLVVSPLDVSLGITVDTPTNAQVGTDVDYDVTITDTSPTGQPDLVLDHVEGTLLGDLTAAATSNGCERLASGDSCTFVITRTVLDTDADPLTGQVGAHYHPDGFTDDVTASDDHSIDLLPATRSQLTPTGTTCDEFTDGSAPTLEQLTYTTKRSSDQVIQSVEDGAFIYWTEVIAPAADFTIDVTQASDGGLPLIELTHDQPKLFDATCTRVHSVTVTRDDANAGASVRVTDATPAARYVLMVKFAPPSLKGTTLPGPNTKETYRYATVIGPLTTNENSIDLRRR